MEDMARLALVEQLVKDDQKFNNVLTELQQLIHRILENPHDKEFRKIKNPTLENLLKHEAFSDYLKYVGFRLVDNEFIYPKEQTLSKLKIAQAAIDRKICFCYGTLKQNQIEISSSARSETRKPKYEPVHVVTSRNSLLMKIENVFNHVLVYEDEELQELARSHIPMVQLQLAAIDSMREQQRRLKSGEEEGQDMTYDIALLLELLSWFKHKFFAWVDKPECPLCSGNTVFEKSISRFTENENCTVEIFHCRECGPGVAEFPRYNDPRTLLRTRRGRCGEWANCFTLLARALGYDARYVLDTTDHVWCEIFDHEANDWLHVDPCECKVDAPLLYSHGWGKKLSYVVAMSRDDLQDVTWRYTNRHRDVLRRRTACKESELLSTILALRTARQKQVSEARRRYLAKRTLRELVNLMLEKQAGEDECGGRESGSMAWRTRRGEVGPNGKGHTFTFRQPGYYMIRYYSGVDQYRVYHEGGEVGAVATWVAGVHECRNIFRKIETDWHMVYLARMQGKEEGVVSWKVSSEGGRFNMLFVRLTTAVFESGQIEWTLQFDEEAPFTVQLTSDLVLQRQFTSAILSAKLQGGAGGLAWQHAQLFRQPASDTHNAFEIHVRLLE